MCVGILRLDFRNFFKVRILTFENYVHDEFSQFNCLSFKLHIDNELSKILISHIRNHYIYIYVYIS